MAVHHPTIAHPQPVVGAPPPSSQFQRTAHHRASRAPPQSVQEDSEEQEPQEEEEEEDDAVAVGKTATGNLSLRLRLDDDSLSWPEVELLEKFSEGYVT
ncbi:unnamed protein product [Vitrella brassicaformis CCMP3155]|uniref:Uncharacterized protein n=1 Tax=Vitrella brassicaformis (strain CCMP3155) TaxID=1169540 RepID=A0A0G4EQB4_VITBC|nr:unnamed protein product [Vitrella brassicaformis CCMP3155]|eukprot:CEL99975.1 unnamed protein product [Vitrella brassicaformis CCMP3155]